MNLKNKIIWGIALFLLVIIIGLFVLVPSVLRFWFILRHLLTYVLLGYVFIVLLIMAYQRILKTYQVKQWKHQLLTVFMLILTMGFMAGLSVVQLRFIEVYETPPLVSCNYYDGYGNLIYTSQYDFSCPELTNVVHGERDGKEVLSFEVTEEVEGKAFKLFLVEGKQHSILPYNKAILTSSFEYTYHYKFVIGKVVLESRVDHYFKRVDQTFELYNRSGIKRTIENRFESLAVTSKETTYHYTIDNKDELMKEISFEELEPTFRAVNSSLSPVDATYSSYLLDMTEQMLAGRDVSFDVLVKGEYTPIHNGYAITIDAYENSRYTHNSVFYQVDGEKITIHGEMGSDLLPRSYMTQVGHTEYKRYRERPFVLSEKEMIREMDGVKEKVTIRAYTTKDATYFIHDKNAMKVTKTDYGWLEEVYSTKREGNHKYRQQEDWVAFIDEQGFNNPVDRPSLHELHDYRFLLFDYFKREKMNYYQVNPLIDGFMLPTAE